MPKKPPRPEKVEISQRRDSQSFFYIGSIPELIIFTVLIILIASYFGIFSADGVVFTRILQKVENTAPDKDQVVQRLNKEKEQRGSYPLDLAAVGVRGQYGSTFIEYKTDGANFELCFSYFPHIANSTSCYYSEVGHWE